jgi:hypothetical protein
MMIPVLALCMERRGESRDMTELGLMITQCTATLTVGGVMRLKLFALFCPLMVKKGLDGGKFRKKFPERLNPQ